jgi:hypothetical protein
VLTDRASEVRSGLPPPAGSPGSSSARRDRIPRHNHAVMVTSTRPWFNACRKVSAGSSQIKRTKRSQAHRESDAPRPIDPSEHTNSIRIMDGCMILVHLGGKPSKRSELSLARWDRSASAEIIKTNRTTQSWVDEESWLWPERANKARFQSIHGLRIRSPHCENRVNEATARRTHEWMVS